MFNSTPATRTARSTTTATSSRSDRPAGDAVQRPELLRAGRSSAQPADAERRRPHRAVGALRHDRREHLHVRLGVRAAAERRLRRPRRRQAEGFGVLGPLLRPGPQQHDQLRRHAHRLDPRRAGLHAINQWVTYRTRGGPVEQDAFFSPTTKTPYTDDLQLGYQVDLGHNMSFDALYINRRTRDILEDYDLALYADPPTARPTIPGPIDDPDSLFLGLDYFGYTENPGSNFVIAHARRRQAQLPRPRVRLPQALRQQLAVAGVLQLQLTPRATPTPTRTPTSRATCSTSIRARRTSSARSRASSATSSRRRVRTSSDRPPARRRLSLELGHDRQPHRPGVGPQPADPRRRARIEFAGVTDRWLTADAVGSLETRRGASSTCGRSTRSAFGRRRHRVLRRHLQRAQQPGLDPQSGSRGRLGRHRVRRADPLPRPAPLLPGRAADVLEERFKRFRRFRRFMVHGVQLTS